MNKVVTNKGIESEVSRLHAKIQTPLMECQARIAEVAAQLQWDGDKINAGKLFKQSNRLGSVSREIRRIHDKG